jgi:protein TonB
MRQLAVAAGLSLVVHAALLLVLAAPRYETAQLAGGGASFGLSSGPSDKGTVATNGSELQTPAQRDNETTDTDEPVDEIHKEAVSQPQQPPAQTPDTDLDRLAAKSREKALRPLTEPVLPPATALTGQVSAPDEVPAKSAPRSALGPNDGRKAKSPRGTTQEAMPAKPSPQGTSARGRQSGVGAGSGTAKSGSGDSAKSNYTGIVTAHIRRNRRSNLAGAGSAILKITIAPGGRIENIDIYRSSGSTRFDRQALRMAKMAAPYPKPPVGQGPVLVRIKGS